MLPLSRALRSATVSTASPSRRTEFCHPSSRGDRDATYLVLASRRWRIGLSSGCFCHASSNFSYVQRPSSSLPSSPLMRAPMYWPMTSSK